MGDGYKIRNVSLDRGLHMEKIPKRLGITIENEKIVFDSWKDARVFSEVISEAIKRFESKEISC